MMVGREHAALRSGHVLEDSRIVQLASELTEDLALVIAAGDGRNRRETRAQHRATRPGTDGAAGKGNAADVPPGNSGTLEAEADRRAGDAGDVSGALELAFFDGRQNARLAHGRRGRVVC